MFQKATFDRLAALEAYHENILREFSELLNTVTLIRSESSSKLRTLQVEKVDAYTIDAMYMGTTVRFQLNITYQNNTAAGRVTCLHKYVTFEKVRFDVIGRFSFGPSGDTDLPPNSRGQIRTLANCADEIVMSFLDKAIESGPSVFAHIII